MRLKSVMGHKFSQVPKADIPRSSFDRSHGYKTTFDAGYLIPVFVDEVYPGDTFNLKMTALARMATPIYPIMDNLFLDSFFFFVQSRLLWDNFERFMGAQDDPDDSTDFLIPTRTLTPTAFSLEDYMGAVPGVSQSLNALPLRAYNLIWNEWFRDQNLQDSLTVPKDDGPDGAVYGVKRRGKRHDYFTSCLPWPQKGDSVDLPLGLSAPVSADPGTENTEVLVYSVGQASTVNLDTDGSAGGSVLFDTADVSGSALYADLSSATAATINQLRQAFQIQKLLERDARGGTRMPEIIKAHFGVTSPDGRLGRPEYLGGGSSRINISPVAQTSRSDTGETPLATLAAIGTGHINGHGFTKSFTEHGYIIGLVNVRADLTYQQGLNRMWSRSTRYDFYFPALAHIGEQAVLNKEIYLQATSADDEVFGYQERFAELRYKPSLITGAFRSNYATPLDAWHLSQDFSTLPVLGNTFIQDNPPLARVVAVDTEPEFLFDAYFDLRCARPMPLFGVPGLIDHF